MSPAFAAPLLNYGIDGDVALMGNSYQKTGDAVRLSAVRRKARMDMIKEYGPRGQHGRKELTQQLARTMASPASETVKRMGQNHWISRLLDSTSTYGGNILPRVDIEDQLYSLFVLDFPLWEMLPDGPANGLLHTWNTISAPNQSAVTDSTITVATETTASTVDTGQYKQLQTANIATFLEQRGISMKEQAAVTQSGMTYNPETQEIKNGYTRLKDVIQRQMFQGNFAVSTGTATNENGLYNTAGMDGLRLIAGGLGAYNSSAVRLDQDSTGKTILQGINTVSARTSNNGGHSSLVSLSNTAQAALMDEQEGKQRVFGSNEIIPGLKVMSVQTQAGELPLLPVPGLNAIGHYNRTSDSVDVEDVFVLDASMIYRRWLGSADINVIELPAGVSGALTRTYLIFAFIGLQVIDAGLFQGKVRIPQTLTS